MSPIKISEDRLQSGHRLSHPPPGDEVVISGVSGSFPNSDSVMELQENLFNKVDLVSSDARRWKLSNPEIPQRAGVIKNLHKLDASFFEVQYKEAHTMDPVGRILLEKAYEAIYDAGVNPNELRGSKTGVFVGASFSEAETTWIHGDINVNGFGLTGCSRAMLANRISYWLGVTGPSYELDTACSSSMYALEHAFRAIREGRCESAIVCGTNICLDPYNTLQFYLTGVLSFDGKCKVFDESADGYVRSETICSIFLQKAKNSRRAYAQIVYAKTSCDGFKEQGISHPSVEAQKVILQEFYEECSIQPYDLEFLEAHGTGTRVGDLVELRSMDSIFTPGRTVPLKIGSVKSNIGHSEQAAGTCAITKMCIAYSTGVIPPNLHFKRPRKDASGLTEKRLEVVTNKTSWGRGLAGVNGFGFGGANAHVLLKNFSTDKVNQGLPFDDLPRLVCVSGRTKSAVARILNELESRTVDIELVKLLHSIHNLETPGHNARGYTLLGSTPNKSITLARDIQYFSSVHRPVWFIYSGLGSQWVGMATNLIKIPVFAAAIHKCHKILEPKGLNLTAILTETDSKIFDSMLNSCIGIVAMQIGLTDVLKTINIKPEHTIGHDIGKFACAYGCGTMTAEEAILSAYNKGSLLIKSHNIDEFIHSEDFEYYQSPVPFEETISCIHQNAITIEVAPHGVLQTVLKSSLKDAVNVALMEKDEKDNVIVLLNALGRLYEAGLNPHLANIYPHVSFPVSQGTPMLAHLVEWEHSDDWCVPYFKIQFNDKIGERSFKISLEDQVHEYMAGHAIDGRVICPAAGYLMLVWQTFGMMINSIYTEVSVVFENVSFQRATYITNDGTLEFTVAIHRHSGDFEVVESGAIVVTGRIYEKKNVGENYNIIQSSLENADSKNESPYLDSKDFYKEMGLRGFHHSGSFRNVLEWNIQNTHGRVSWINNWVTFIDSLLQIKIFSTDTRALTIPTGVDKLTIDINMHYNTTSKMNMNSPNNYFDVNMYRDNDVIRSGGVEVRGLHVTPISLKPERDAVVLEKAKFFANFGLGQMKVEEILRSHIQLIMENIQFYKVKTIEFIDDEYKKNGYQPLHAEVEDILRDIPLVRPEIIVVSNNLNEVPQGTTKLNTLHGLSNVAVFIGANLLGRSAILRQAISTLGDKCFIISRENKCPDLQQFSDRFDVVCVHNTGVEYLVLFRERAKVGPTRFINIITSDLSYAWIDEVKNNLKDGQKLVLYSQNEPFNGVLGLVRCLRKEPGGENVYGLIISDLSAPAFNPDEKFYKQQLDKDLVINIYQDGQWGTYRHLLLEELETVRTSHAYVNTVNIGDLSSLKWLEGPLTVDHEFKNPQEVLVHVYCAALNFRDIMTATGRLKISSISHDRQAQECAQGIEIAGKTNNGNRVMAMVSRCGLANLAVGFKPVLLPIPEAWSFEEAATVPVAYSTAYYAMVMVGQMQRGESILIHAGSGGVGQAAINVALHYGCEIFTTVGTAEKRAFIKKHFPQIKDSHIGNSRDTTFEDMIRSETNGKGVDLVLNSLSDDKLQASIRCLGFLGRFLEIGKFDINNNTSIGMHFFSKEVSFHSIMLDYMIEKFELGEIQKLQKLILDGIESGAVRPLTYCTFKKNEVEAAFRYMAAGKHVGKVIIKIRDDDQNSFSTKPIPMPIEATPRYTCHEDRVYILVGGLGGIGLELADWLILRGARKVLLTSRRGVLNGYQAYRLRAWASYGAIVQISTDNSATEEGCEAMLKAANAMGSVEAIFNLAAVLKDAVFLNQTPESFRACYESKAMTSINLDKLSRKMCRALKHFVVFSSVSCGHGVAGLTNYGFSNSVMEKVCEMRQESGLPALAIQWGAIGDVGLLANSNNASQSGTLQQKITSCLSVLDKFLKQNATIVSSFVVAEKKASGSGKANIVESIAQIMGIKDLKKVSQQASLAELGMDSITSVEIKQALEREYEIFLTPHDIRTMTFSKLLEVSKRKESVSSAT